MALHWFNFSEPWFQIKAFFKSLALNKGSLAPYGISLALFFEPLAPNKGSLAPNRGALAHVPDYDGAGKIHLYFLQNEYWRNEMQIIVMTAEELKEVISEVIKTELKNYRLTDNNTFSQEKEEYVTFNETLRLLKISRPTLFKRMRDSTIPYSRMGKRLLFPKSKIMKILEQSSSILKR